MAFDNEADIGLEMVRRCLTCPRHQKVMGDIFVGCLWPDPEMRGQNRGVKEGLWHYPWFYDPLWAATLCEHWMPPAMTAAVIQLEVAA